MSTTTYIFEIKFADFRKVRQAGKVEFNFYHPQAPAITVSDWRISGGGIRVENGATFDNVIVGGETEDQVAVSVRQLAREYSDDF